MNNMKDINKRDTAILLANLDREIDIKCIELKERHRELKLKKIFFLSCLIIFFSILIQLVFRIFNVSFIIEFLVYQIIALAALMPMILKSNKGVV